MIPKIMMLWAAIFAGAAAVTMQPEFLLPTIALAAGSVAVRRSARQKQVTRSLKQLEERLSLTEGELEGANTELQQIKTEREFDRQLLRKSGEAPNDGSDKA